MKNIIAFIFFSLFSICAFAQEAVKVVNGKVHEITSAKTIPGTDKVLTYEQLQAKVRQLLYEKNNSFVVYQAAKAKYVSDSVSYYNYKAAAIATTPVVKGPPVVKTPPVVKKPPVAKPPVKTKKVK